MARSVDPLRPATRCRATFFARAAVATGVVLTALVVRRPLMAQDSVAGTAGKADTTLVASGLELYRQQYCGLCHTLDKAQTAGIFGPTHNNLAATARERIASPGYTGAAKTAEQYVRESIVKPEVYIVPGFEVSVHRMPSYAHLKPAELDAIIGFLLDEECAVEECSVPAQTEASP